MFPRDDGTAGSDKALVQRSMQPNAFPVKANAGRLPVSMGIHPERRD